MVPSFQPLVYVDTSDVRDGALDELKDAIRELADFVAANEPWLISYSAFLSEDDGQMTVIHLHQDATSLDRHMEIAGPRFERFADLLTLTSIRIYGRPSEHALQRLRNKARMLGAGDVVVHPLHAGFARPG